MKRVREYALRKRMTEVWAVYSDGDEERIMVANHKKKFFVEVG